MKMKCEPVIDLGREITEQMNDLLLENTRIYLANTLNRLMIIELTEFLGYEKSARSAQRNARNGFYRRPLETPAGLIEVKIPRDRQGLFTPSMFPKYSRENDKVGYLAYDLCQAGLGKMDMNILAQKHFGISYSEKARSRMTDAVSEEIQNYRDRLLSAVPEVQFDTLREHGMEIFREYA